MIIAVHIVIYHNMMKKITIVLGICLISILTLTAQSENRNNYSRYAIDEPSNAWVLDMVDSIRYQTSLCETCMSPPTFKRFEDKLGRTLFRLRFACDAESTFVKIYSDQGDPIAHCIVGPDLHDCVDFEEYTDFAFTKNLLNIWSCKDGFFCPAKDTLGLFRQYDILVSGSECVDKIRQLSVDAPFTNYQWNNSDGKSIFTNNIMADQSGMYNVTVQDHDGCNNKKSQEVRVYADKEILGNKVLCPDETTFLKSEGFLAYQWSTGETTAKIEVAEPGPISLTIIDAQGCVDSISTEVITTEDRSVTVRAGEDLFFRNQVIPVQLSLNNLESDDIKDIFWSSEGELTCDDCFTPFGKFSEESEILVMITDQNDCVYEHAITVKPEIAYKDVYAANIFTPDGDGENDIFMIRSLEGAAVVNQFKVFNRWGVPIHNVGRHLINDISKGWDGTTQDGNQIATGVYIYMAEVEFTDGSIEHITGDILLVR